MTFAEKSEMKRFTLKVHQSNFSEESLVINTKDFPDVRRDDIVKIYSCDGDPSNHLVMKVKSLKKDGELQKNTVSIEQTLAQRFNLHAFQSVHVVKVDPMEISLDMMEVIFKEQYVSRSDMWRLKRHLAGSCTCVSEKVEFCDIRAQVNELWIDGNKVKCGLVTDSTRIVLRSATALVYIFIQMSQEMWDFDAYGQLQFEKAVDGFLKNLFNKWKEKCYHEFTLVIFSRSFFNASGLEQFPCEVRHAVQRDYCGRLYIDFYYCVAHRERSDDCSPLLFRLKRLFNDYKNLVHIPNCPPHTNSTASEGNFLEAINMSLNVFEKHYVDRNFDRTGQLVLCITPGVGVFDVDRDLTVLTKERMIDNGIGSDLVCLGQEPLHTVPLFKFHHKTKHLGQREVPHSFNIPHWINHSFYSPNPFQDKGSVGIKHVPRVTFSLKKDKFPEKRSMQSSESNEKCLQRDLPSLLKCSPEEFDNEIFGSPRVSHPYQNQSRLSARMDRQNSTDIRKTVRGRVRTISDSLKQNPTMDHVGAQSTSSPLHIPRQLVTRTQADAREARSLGPAWNLDKYFSKKETESGEMLVGSAHSFHAHFSKRKHVPQRALINPFVTSNAMQPVTSNRRRWVHTHPNPRPSLSDEQRLSERISESSDLCEDSLLPGIELQIRNPSMPKSSQSVVGSVTSSELSAGDAEFFGGFGKMHEGITPKSNFLEAPAVNWKSLRSPACLPITNDYFPSKLRLNSDYTEQSYDLIPDHDDAGIFGEQGTNYQQMTTREVFLELVNQRLCQGFQLVVSGLPKYRIHYDSLTISSGLRSPISSRKDTSFTSTEDSDQVYPQSSGSIASPESAEAYTLNHGRQYHVVSLTGENAISVKIYKPRHPFLTSTIEYKYLLWAVGRDRFRVANVKFSHEQYDQYHWNYQDNCVCVGGADSDFKITEALKYWRAKFFVIPSPSNKLKQQKSETEVALKNDRSPRYDIFSIGKPSDDIICKVFDGMLRFFDYINKVRRTAHATSSQGHLPQKLTDKPADAPFSSTGLLAGSAPSTPSPKVLFTHSPASNSRATERAVVNSQVSDMPKKLHEFSNKQEFDQNDMGDDGNAKFVNETSPTQSWSQKAEEEETLAKHVLRLMQDTESSFTFLQHQGRLQNNSFLSADAVHWCLDKDFGFTEIDDAVSLLEKMRQMKYICHASWDFNHPFLHGYYIFHIVPEAWSSCENDLDRNFGSEWLELEMKLKEDLPLSVHGETPQKRKPRSALSRQLERDFRRYSGLSNMKTVLIPLNNKHKTNRNEWCQVQHPATIMPLRGSATFTFNVQWMVATATCLFEMLQCWLREANRCGLCMIPSPDNPFAFPHTEKDASPLHCPLFVPLNLEMLSEKRPAFQKVVKGEEVQCRLHIIDFMENIAQRFGFQSYHVPIDSDAQRSNAVNSRHFVHYTGQVFLEIPVTRELKVQGRTVASRQQYYSFSRIQSEELPATGVEHQESDCNTASDLPPSLDVSKRGSQSFVNLKDCGFYFSVNHMLTKRWRLPAHEDCPVNELEADFIQLCSCVDGRLVELYESIYS